MDQNQATKPTFREPEYGDEGGANVCNAEASVDKVVSDDTKPVQPPTARENDSDDSDGSASHQSKRLSTQKTASDNDITEPNQITTGEGSGTNHLTFTETAKNAAGHVSRKLHLHRGEEKGPSEARARRQSTFVSPENEQHLPIYVHFRNALFGSLTMFTTFPYWDMAFWSGSSYTYGSILFVIDGAWAWTPQRWPESEFEGESEYGVGLLFFFGALFYQVGATMAYLEAINDGSFGGRAMKRHLEGHDEEAKQMMDKKLHAFFGHMIPHHHHDDNEDLEKQKSWQENPTRRGGVDVGDTEKDAFHEYLTWRWWPTWKALKSYHMKEMGYVACAIQLFGATLYGICGVISLPGILSGLSTGQTIGGYWVVQTVASVCFLTAGIMFTLVTQEKWNRPVPRRIAWWIGVWATIGSCGFLASAAFGIRSADYTWCEYQSSLSSMWGSFAYLVSSYLQWYESVNHGPVLAFPNNRIPTMMRENMK